MGQSLEFIKDRALKTTSAAEQLAPVWIWQEKTPAQMSALLVAITGNRAVDPPVVGQEEITSQAEQTMLHARGLWDAGLDQLHRWTLQGVGMAKNRFRNNPPQAAQLDGLTAKGDSRAATLKEALDWESAWANVDPAWAPLPANTLAAFRALRKQCLEDLQDAYADGFAAWSKDAKKLGQMARDLEDVNEAWYADALRVFPAGTPEGDLIRGTIPTTYNPPSAKPTPPPPPPTA